MQDVTGGAADAAPVLGHLIVRKLLGTVHAAVAAFAADEAPRLGVILGGLVRAVTALVTGLLADGALEIGIDLALRAQEHPVRNLAADGAPALGNLRLGDALGAGAEAVAALAADDAELLRAVLGDVTGLAAGGALGGGALGAILSHVAPLAAERARQRAMIAVGVGLLLRAPEHDVIRGTAEQAAVLGELVRGERVGAIHVPVAAVAADVAEHLGHALGAFHALVIGGAARGAEALALAIALELTLGQLTRGTALAALAAIAVAGAVRPTSGAIRVGLAR